jgi:hypothetical protein
MPGWKPPVEYVREMKRHGILPESFDAKTNSLDPYETDQRYWNAITGHHLPGDEPPLFANPMIRKMCLMGTLTPDGDEFIPDAASLTTGKPVTCSQALAEFPAHFANDGRADDTNRFWAMDVANGDPAWWQVDLEKPTEVGRIVVVGYYGDRRHYGFIVETSIDGVAWEMVADRRDNQAPSLRAGYTCVFEKRAVRFVRVTQTGNSANTGRHLVEVMAFER